MVKKAVYLLVGILVVYAVLTATHKGEFWPFSIYPMFSEGAQPWNVAIVQKVDPSFKQSVWMNKAYDELPGSTIGLNQIDPAQVDLSVFFNKGSSWNKARVRALRRLFKNRLDDKEFLIYKVHGQVAHNEGKFVKRTCVPLILITRRYYHFNPYYFVTKEGL